MFYRYNNKDNPMLDNLCIVLNPQVEGDYTVLAPVGNLGTRDFCYYGVQIDLVNVEEMLSQVNNKNTHGYVYDRDGKKYEAEFVKPVSSLEYNLLKGQGARPGNFIMIDSGTKKTKESVVRRALNGELSMMLYPDNVLFQNDRAGKNIASSEYMQREVLSPTAIDALKKKVAINVASIEFINGKKDVLAKRGININTKKMALSRVKGNIEAYRSAIKTYEDDNKQINYEEELVYVRFYSNLDEAGCSFDETVKTLEELERKYGLIYHEYIERYDEDVMSAKMLEERIENEIKSQDPAERARELREHTRKELRAIRSLYELDAKEYYDVELANMMVKTFDPLKIAEVNPQIYKRAQAIANARRRLMELGYSEDDANEIIDSFDADIRAKLKIQEQAPRTSRLHEEVSSPIPPVLVGVEEQEEKGQEVQVDETVISREGAIESAYKYFEMNKVWLEQMKNNVAFTEADLAKCTKFYLLSIKSTLKESGFSDEEIPGIVEGFEKRYEESLGKRKGM